VLYCYEIVFYSATAPSGPGVPSSLVLYNHTQLDTLHSVGSSEGKISPTQSPLPDDK